MELINESHRRFQTLSCCSRARLRAASKTSDTLRARGHRVQAGVRCGALPLEIVRVSMALAASPQRSLCLRETDSVDSGRLAAGDAPRCEPDADERKLAERP
jgi:hypothetical protein